jgi:ABC-type lipoprotein release transport system permease subunit
VSSTLRIAWRNLGRSRRRTAITLAAIAIAQIGVLAINGVLNGRNEWMIDAITGPVIGHVQVHAPGWREEQAPDLVIDRLEERLAAIRAVDGVAQAYPRLYAPALAARDVDGHAVVVIGVDVEREMRSGGMLDGLATALQPHDRTILVGARLAREAGIGVGDELAVVGSRADGSIASDLFVVGGVLATPVELVNRSGLIVPLASAQDTFGMEDMAHEITIRGAGRGEEAPQLAARVSAVPELDGLEVLPWRELAPEIAAAMDTTAAVGLVVLLVVFVAAAAGVANTMLMAIFERRRELGMMLSLGTTPSRLVAMILAEAVALGMLGVTIGTAIGGALVAWLGVRGLEMLDRGQEIAAFGVSFSGALHPFLEVRDVAGGFVGVAFVSVLAALWPALVTARLEPMEAMRS